MTRPHVTVSSVARSERTSDFVELSIRIHQNEGQMRHEMLIKVQVPDADSLTVDLLLQRAVAKAKDIIALL